jgi:hypothetical protein
VEQLSAEVVEDLRHGRAPRERKIAVCTTGAHLPPADRIEILTVLAKDEDEAVSSRASEALLSYGPEAFLQPLRRENAVPPLFAYAGKELGSKPGIAEALLHNKNCGGEYLVPVVGQLSGMQVQELVLELDRISATPELAAALERLPNLTAEHKSILQELRSTAIDEGRLAEAAADAEPDPARRQTMLQQIGRMTVAQRVQYAMKGSGEARRTLIRDSNKVVQRAVLLSPRLTDQEVEAYASMPNLTDEILRQIANNRNFRKNYVVVKNLINNPKTPLDLTLNMLPALNAVDLKRLTSNKNVPETLRTTAMKLQRTRNEAKKK